MRDKDTPSIGTVKRIDPREVWPHEASDFTPWLQENIEVLDEALDLRLVSSGREQPAGAFSVDLIAEDAEGNSVVIENQLGTSDHDHLGKVVTYLALVDAKSAIWIVGQPRPEHVSAVAKLNEGSADFFLVKLEAIRIGDSPPAPLFTLITGPSIEVKEEGNRKKEVAALHSKRREYWSGLLDYANRRSSLHSNSSPGVSSWLGTMISSGIQLTYYVLTHHTAVSIYIDKGQNSDQENRTIFQRLKSRKDQIEDAFGEPLEWIDVEGVRSCRIHKYIDSGGLSDQDKWPEIHKATVDAMIRFEQALRPHLSFANELTKRVGQN